jgi:hypothetical protein
MKMTDDEQLFRAWRNSEAYQVPMTEEGERLAAHRWYGFQLGWEYAKFYAKHGNIDRKEYLEEYKDE